MHPLTALSPLDGRYADKLTDLQSIFSEYGLIKARLVIETEWLIFLTNEARLPDVKPLSAKAITHLKSLTENFSIDQAKRVKTIEATTNHDVKAIEYLMKEHIKENKELDAINELIHFGCTSEDVNNLAYALMLKETREKCLLPTLTDLINQLKKLSHEYANISMLARTHGQAATPTTLGKELANVVARLNRQLNQLKEAEILGKLNGATGNFNALHAAYPNIDWQNTSKQFIEALGLTYNAYTTQIEPHDSLSEFFAILARIHTILIDFARDTWGYISIGYFNQKSLAKEVGSSTMPHKINPIDFENAEGNLGLSNALLAHFIEKLPVSRWQRDLSDSTVLRNIGVALGHGLLAYQSLARGLQKLTPNLDAINADLDAHWEVLGEAIQTMMRRYHLKEPYEQLKAFTRGKKMSKELLHQFISQLELPADAKKTLLALTPADYIGFAAELAKKV